MSPLMKRCAYNVVAPASSSESNPSISTGNTLAPTLFVLCILAPGFRNLSVLGGVSDRDLLRMSPAVPRKMVARVSNSRATNAIDYPRQIPGDSTALDGLADATFKLRKFNCIH